MENRISLKGLESYKAATLQENAYFFEKLSLPINGHQGHAPCPVQDECRKFFPQFYDSGVSLQGVRDYLGHVYEEMTQQYIDYMPRKIEKANEKYFKEHGSLAAGLKIRKGGSGSDGKQVYSPPFMPFFSQHSCIFSRNVALL